MRGKPYILSLALGLLLALVACVPASAQITAGRPDVLDNQLLNGDFRIFQRTATPNSFVTVGTDYSYGFDRWAYSRAHAGWRIRSWRFGIESNALLGPGLNAGAYAQLNNNSGSTSSFMLIQHVPSEWTAAMRGRPLTLSATGIGSNGTYTLRVRLVSWNGTADSSSAKQVLDGTTPWSSGVPQWKTTNHAAAASGSAAMSSESVSANNWVTASSTTASVATDTTNLIAVVWVENVASGHTVYVSKVGLWPGPAAPRWSTRRNELSLCQQACKPLAGGAAYSIVGTGFYNTTTQAVIHVPIAVSMRTTPTLTYSALSDFEIADQPGNTDRTISALTIDANYVNPANGLLLRATTAAGTLGAGVLLRRANTTSGTLYLDAEY